MEGALWLSAFATRRLWSGTSAARCSKAMARSMSAVRPWPWSSTAMTRWCSARTGMTHPKVSSMVSRPPWNSTRGGPSLLVVHVEPVDVAVRHAEEHDTTGPTHRGGVNPRARAPPHSTCDRHDARRIGARRHRGRTLTVRQNDCRSPIRPAPNDTAACAPEPALCRGLHSWRNSALPQRTNVMGASSALAQPDGPIRVVCPPGLTPGPGGLRSGPEDQPGPDLVRHCDPGGAS